MAIEDMFDLAAQKGDISYGMSFFEIYGGRCYDLLNKNKRVEVLEDGNNEVLSQLVADPLRSRFRVS